MGSCPRTSVIITNYNGADVIGPCIESIIESLYHDYEIIIIDDASNDNSRNVIESLINKYKNLIHIYLIGNEFNLGPSASRNIGIFKARGELIAFLDNDVVVDRYWLQELIRLIDSDDNIAGCASKIYIYGTGKRLLNSAGVRIFNTGHGIDIGLFEIDEGQFDEKSKTLAGCTASTLYKKSVLKEVGLFDAKFFYPLEDVDIGLRINLFGYSIVYCPSSIVEHRLSYTMGLSNPNKDFYLTERNRILILLKNFQIITLAKLFPENLIFFCNNFLSIIKKPYNARYFLKAYRDVLLLFPFIIKSRDSIQKNRRIYDKDIFNNNFVISSRDMRKVYFPDYRIETEESVEKDRYVGELIFGVNEESYLGFGWYSLQKSELENRDYRFMGKEGLIFLPKLTTKYLKIEFFNPLVDKTELGIFINEINCFRKNLLLNQKFNELILTIPNNLIDGFAKINFKVSKTVIPNDKFKNKDFRNVSIGVSKISQIDDPFEIN